MYDVYLCCICPMYIIYIMYTFDVTVLVVGLFDMLSLVPVHTFQ